ncbi:hypothetical protein BGZ94_002256 [Podila epigama]|nr:hypothetical protein BGZ94_002256 [Podila epigama]
MYVLGMAPVENEAVKNLPIEQPIWPIPTRFSHGSESIILSPDMVIKVHIKDKISGDNGQPLASLASYPILEKAISRCLDRLAAKRNTTRSNVEWTTSPNDDNILSELEVVISDPKAALEYGVQESYELNITTGVPHIVSRQMVAVKDFMNDNLDPIVQFSQRNIEIDQDQDVGQEVMASSRGHQSTMMVHTGGTRAILTASTQWGVLHGLETFTQLVRSISVSSVQTTEIPPQKTQKIMLEIPNAPWSIQDTPRFSHRGLLLDTSRHYIPVEDILRTLEAMSTVKLNVFHWHVLDQQSYGLVSKRFPELTAKGSETPDRVYSVEAVARIIGFGEERGIRVVPEFDAPGHTASWGRAFPNITVCQDALPHSKYAAEPPAGQLDPLEPFTYKVLEGLIEEWAGQFPDKHVHIGGDEINYNCWRMSARLREYIEVPERRLALEEVLPKVPEPPTTTATTTTEIKMRRTRSGHPDGEDALLAVYLDRAIGMYLNQRKIPIVWEEIALEHNVRLPDNTVVQVWKNAKNAKKVITQGRPVILSSGYFWYLDCGNGNWLVGSLGKSWCGFASWQRVYSYILTDKLTLEQEKMVYGGEIAMWSEQTDSSNLDSNVWPRAAAAAEILWSGSFDENGQARPLLPAAKRLAVVRERLVEMGVRAAPIFPSWCTKHPEACLKEE